MTTADLCPERDEGLDEDRGLDRHVQAARVPASGLVPPYYSRVAMRPGISFSAVPISLRPQAVRSRSATL